MKFVKIRRITDVYGLPTDILDIVYQLALGIFLELVFSIIWKRKLESTQFGELDGANCYIWRWRKLPVSALMHL
jgi:hypothetical protein